ncbi:phosphopantetheine-binding protein, partial [Dactylosporangium vinaceum]
LTENGKIDKRALPEPQRAAAPTQGAVGEEQRALCALFADVLRLERVGPDEDFFDLGGHSLLATQLASRIRSDLGRHADVTDIFEAPTVNALTVRLGSDRPQRPALRPMRRQEEHA